MPPLHLPSVVILSAAFGEVKKRVRTTAGGSTGSVRNLRIREDTAKYLLNLDASSAHYDPKSRSMREDPNPNKVIVICYLLCVICYLLFVVLLLLLLRHEKQRKDCA